MLSNLERLFIAGLLGVVLGFSVFAYVRTATLYQNNNSSFLQEEELYDVLLVGLASDGAVALEEYMPRMWKCQAALTDPLIYCIHQIQKENAFQIDGIDFLEIMQMQKIATLKKIECSHCNNFIFVLPKKNEKTYLIVDTALCQNKSHKMYRIDIPRDAEMDFVHKKITTLFGKDIAKKIIGRKKKIAHCTIACYDLIF